MTALRRGDAVFDATTSRQLQRAVDAFAAVLRTIPDGPPDETAEATLQLLQLTSERVIQRIEDRLAIADRQAVQRKLAGAIYELRRTLEALDYWRRHYGRWPLSAVRPVQTAGIPAASTSEKEGAATCRRPTPSSRR